MTIYDDGKALDALRERVETALRDYAADVMNCSAGYAVLRHACQGHLDTNDSDAGERLFLVMHPHGDPLLLGAAGQAMFGVLRDARAGRLFFAQPRVVDVELSPDPQLF